MRQTEFGSARKMCLAHKMLDRAGLDCGLSRRESLATPKIVRPRRENVAKQDGKGESTTTKKKHCHLISSEGDQILGTVVVE